MKEITRDEYSDLKRITDKLFFKSSGYPPIYCNFYFFIQTERNALVEPQINEFTSKNKVQGFESLLVHSISGTPVISDKFRDPYKVRR